jgi:apolipoprotein N-acyltransferase
VSVTRFAHSIVLAWGWRRAAIGFFAGAFSALALPPGDFWPVMLVTFPLLVWLLDGAGAGRGGGVFAAAVTGWFFGFGYVLAGLYWVGYAFLVDAETFGWLLPIAVAGLPAGLAIFTAFGCALARALWVRGPLRILALAVALTAVEWLRGHMLTGFPWNTSGYALTGPLALAQAASLTGIWGLTFLAVAAFASPATLADDPLDTRRRWLPLVMSACVIAALAVFGAVRLNAHPTSFVEGVHLRVMQPNTPQDDKFNYSAKEKVMKHYITLSDRSTGPQSTGIGQVTHLIWPEAAFPFFLTKEADAMAQIADLLPQGSVLITGAVRAPDVPPGTPITRAYNSIYLIGDDGGILSVYDKLHLVPFGEYLPFQNLMEELGFEQLTKMRGGFIPGTRRRTMEVPRAPRMLPLICYEVIFPSDAMTGDDRPGWIVNLTNDGWFGISTGPYQHLQQARLRAIEQGLPLVRAANTGISAVIDPLGRIVAQLGLGREGVLDSSLPAAIPPTLYARTGNMPTIIVISIVIVLVVRRRPKRRS